jgi:hypothetical protein
VGKAVDQLLVVVVANTTNANVLTGRLLDRAPFLARAKIYAAGSAAGLQATITAGMTTVARAVDINAQNRIPVDPDDLLVDDILMAPGDGFGISVTNTTGGNLTLNIRIVLEELEMA